MISVEVVFAERERQLLECLEVEAGCTIEQVLELSQLYTVFPQARKLPVGIWGRAADRSDTVQDGDRVEVYRPLAIDPREARRKLAASGRTMREGPTGSGRVPDPYESRSLYRH